MSKSPSGSSQQHPTEEGNAKKRKVFRKQGAFSQTRNDLGTLGTLPLLKSEADAIQRAGIKHLLRDLHELIQPHLHSYLSGTAMLQQYENIHGYQYVEANTAVLEELADLTSHLDVKTGTYRIRVSEEVCMNVCCKLIGLLKPGSMAADNEPTLVLEVNGGTHKSGGFEDAYTLVNVPLRLMNKAEQERCVFAMRATQFKSMTGVHGGALLKEVQQRVMQFVSPFKVLATPLVHVLFHFNDHAFISRAGRKRLSTTALEAAISSHRWCTIVLGGRRVVPSRSRSSSRNCRTTRLIPKTRPDLYLLLYHL
jgi:hypothetical protein